MIELRKYLGKWYQFAAYPQFYEPANAYNITAEYRMEAGVVTVRNRLVNKGQERIVTGTLTPTGTPDHYRVRLEKAVFGFAVTADYDILAVFDNYKYAIVGNARKSSLYLLSRTAEVPCKVQRDFQQRITALGYDWNRLRFSKHLCIE